MTAPDMTTVMPVASAVGATGIDAPGSDAARLATEVSPTSMGCAASAKIDASGWIHAVSMPAKIMGCASSRSGVAVRLLSGATRLTRPNTQATIGAEPIVAIVVPMSVRAIVLRSQCRRWTPIRRLTIPAEIIDATPTTLSW